MQLPDQPCVRFPDLHRVQTEPVSKTFVQTFENPCDPIAFELACAEASQQIGLPGHDGEHRKNAPAEIFMRLCSAEGGLHCPEAGRPAFEDIVGDLIVHVLDLEIPNRRAFTAEEREDGPSDQFRPSMGAVIERQDLQGSSTVVAAFSGLCLRYGRLSRGGDDHQNRTKPQDVELGDVPGFRLRPDSLVEAIDGLNNLLPRRFDLRPFPPFGRGGGLFARDRRGWT
jgi:hypothetical protein